LLLQVEAHAVDAVLVAGEVSPHAAQLSSREL
jgi:hypothetical protein